MLFVPYYVSYQLMEYRVSPTFLSPETMRADYLKTKSYTWSSTAKQPVKHHTFTNKQQITTTNTTKRMYCV